MCGILAVVDLKNRSVSEATARRMRDTMVHRGPDDAGLFVDGPVGLGHRRLSIIDLSHGGHQPMSSEDGSVHLVFNGEIYNYIELREDLRKRGHVFRSSSDTEVLLRQYEEDGEDCVRKLRGMFAFAIWDRRKQKLFAARDRFGIKPLSYFADGDKFLLASEVKAILEAPDVRRRPDMAGLADYLYAGRPLGGKTMFEGIHELEPGHQLRVDLQSRALSVTRYWDLRYAYDYRRPYERTTDELFAMLDDAVDVHCRSDAPLGCHLSGGIDSSAVVGFAARHRARLPTFSIKFSDEEHIDETRYAKAVARHVGAEYLESSPTAADLAALLPFLIWHMDMPMMSDGAFGYFAVSEFAKRHVKVSLTGHGGDEVFAGYPAQFKAAFNTTEMFRLHQDPERLPASNGWLRRMLARGPRRLYGSLRARTRTPSLEDLWIALHCNSAPADNPWLHPALLEQLNGYSPRDAYIAPLTGAPTDQALDKCLYHDLRVYLPSLLHLEDRLSMAVSIESRVPLLDNRLVELLATIPPEQKVRGLQPKHLLRQAASRLLPAEVMQNREKRGFPVPGRFWKTPTVSETVSRILLSKQSLARGVFSERALRAASENVTQYWPLVNVELWFKLFIDRDPEWLGRAKDRREALVRC